MGSIARMIPTPVNPSGGSPLSVAIPSSLVQEGRGGARGEGWEGEGGGE